jgi:hypothetical protein
VSGKTNEDHEESPRITGYTTNLVYLDLQNVQEECYYLGVRLQKAIMPLKLLKTITFR